MAADDISEPEINDSTYVEIIHAPVARRRTYLDANSGEVQRFYVQLEYNRCLPFDEPDDWIDIAWFDHQPDNENGHDIRKEGLHMDVRHPNGFDRKVTTFPNVDRNKAPHYCERYFNKNYEEICIRYAKWAGDLTADLLTILPTLQ